MIIRSRDIGWIDMKNRISQDGELNIAGELNMLVTLISAALILWISLGAKFCELLIDIPILLGLDALEIRDRLSVVLICMLIPICTLFNTAKIAQSVPIRFQSVLSLSAFLVMIFSFGWTTNYMGTPNPTFWGGFGYQPAFAAFVLIGAFYMLKGHLKVGKLLNRMIRPLNLIIWVTIFIAYVPSFIQFPNGIIGASSRWPLNELIAPLTGHVPLSNFTAQYSNLLGFPLLLLRHIVSTTSTPMVALLWVNALIVLQMLLMGRLTRLMFPILMYGYCFGIPIVLIFVKTLFGQNQHSSIAESMTAIPGRTLFPVISISLLIGWMRSERGLRTSIRAGFTGAAVAITMLNNFEFGVSAALVIILIIILGTISHQRYFYSVDSLVFFGGILSTFGVIRIGFVLTGNEFHFLRLVAYSRVFGKQGFSNLPMPTFGLYLFVFVTLAVAAIFGLKSSGCFLSGRQIGKELLSGQVVAVFFGTWGVISLMYYAGRSANPGQLQSSLVPLSLALVALLRLFVGSESLSTTKLRQIGFRSPLVLLWMTVPVVSILQIPNPIIEFSRITQSEISWSTESIRLSARGVAVARYLGKYPHSKVGYFGLNPHLTQVALGIQSVSGVNDPGDIFTSPTIYELACQDIVKFKVSEVIVPVQDLPESQVGLFCTPQGLVYQGLSNDSLLHIYALHNKA